MINTRVINFPNIYSILDAAVKDIFNRVAGLEMLNACETEMQTRDLWFMAVTTQGDYRLTLVLCTESALLYAIVRKMKRGREVCETDLPTYATEFFNILCGHIVSELNRRNHITARFGIPLLVKGVYLPAMKREAVSGQEYYYSCGAMTAKIEVIEEHCQRTTGKEPELL